MKSFIVFSVRAAPWHVVVVLWWWWWWCAFRPPRPIKISLTHDFTPKIKPIKPPLPFIFLHLRTCRIWLVCNLSLKASCCIVIGHAPPPTHFLPPPATRPQPWTTLDPGACASWMMTFNLLYFDASEMFNTHTEPTHRTRLQMFCTETAGTSTLHQSHESEGRHFKRYWWVLAWIQFIWDTFSRWGRATESHRTHLHVVVCNDCCPSGLMLCPWTVTMITIYRRLRDEEFARGCSSSMSERVSTEHGQRFKFFLILF